jgi:hypothetical protein
MHNTSGTADAPAGRAYDERFKRTLIREILDAIAKTSVLPGSNTVMLRAGETVEALLSTLIAMAAMSPAFDAPETLNQFAETTAKRIRREVAKARAQGRFDSIVLGAQRQGGRS